MCRVTTYEQQCALSLVQALLGVISSNFRFVSIKCETQKITIRIILEYHCEEDLKEIEDFETEFEALLLDPIDYTVLVDVTDEPIVCPDDSSIVVFRRRENLVDE